MHFIPPPPPPPVALAVVHSKTVLLLLIRCLLMFPLFCVGFVTGRGFVMQNLVFLLVVQSSRFEREGWLLYFDVFLCVAVIGVCLFLVLS